MIRYALLDSHAGYVWWVGMAASPCAAAGQCDTSVGVDDRRYEELSASEARGGRDHYLVYDATALAGDVEDGQDQTAIDAVSALPLVAYVGWAEELCR